MFSKRIRNKKLETNRQLMVYYTDELDQSLLLDYVHTNLKTGVEQDEEKEIHLKKLLESGKGDIVIPKITVNTDIVKNYGEYRPPEKYIKHGRDVPNEYVLQEEDYKFLEDEKIELSDFKRITKMIGTKEYEKLENSSVKEKITNYYSKRMVKLIGNDDYDAYLCFRKRTNVPGRKNRRSEASTLEKLKRAYLEFTYLDKLLSLKEEQQKLNEEILSINYEIFGITDVLKTSCCPSRRKKIYRKLYRKEKIKKPVPFYKTCSSFSDLLADRKKIYDLKKTLLNPKRILSEKEIENESRIMSRINKKNPF
ncbi:Polycomb enhancer protein, EPC [Trachipleistophora hominis]|uniref:Polycomb enhancer protein, EPC n=1 Tax=Trachipleistophora hominis TaxID=72359 RepID=L7JZ16_TRAHO|nr:Polycomb enhancer protein, EPC [Trachipleistophora hominis]